MPRGAQVFPQVFRRSSPAPGHKGLEVFPEVFPGIKRLPHSMVNYQLSVVKNIAVFSKNEPDFLNGYRLCSYQTTYSTERLPVCASKNPKQSVAPQFTSRDIQRDGKGNTFSCNLQANLSRCYSLVFSVWRRYTPAATRRTSGAPVFPVAAVVGRACRDVIVGSFFSLRAAFWKNKKIGQKFCGAIFFSLYLRRTH